MIPIKAGKTTLTIKHILLITLNLTILFESIFKDAMIAKEYTPNSVLRKLIVIKMTIIPINPRTIKSLNLYYPVHSATINNMHDIYCTNTQISYLFSPNKYELAITTFENAIRKYAIKYGISFFLK